MLVVAVCVLYVPILHLPGNMAAVGGARTRCVPFYRTSLCREVAAGGCFGVCCIAMGLLWSLVGVCILSFLLA